MTDAATGINIRLIRRMLCVLALLFSVIRGSAQTSVDSPLTNDSLPEITRAECDELTTSDTSSVEENGETVAKSNLEKQPEERGQTIHQSDSLGVFDMFTNLPSDWYNWSKQTFTVDNIPLITALGVMTAAMVVSDYELWQPAKKLYDKSPFTKELSDRFVDVGDGKFQFGLAVGFGLYGVVFSDRRALRTASQVTEVILACGTVVQLLKHLTGRESPFTATTRTGNWTLFPNQIEYLNHVPHYDAFPSGHIATAMATMIVISENYPSQKWIKYIGYPVVAMVGFGLTATSIHWVSDFPLGLALGYSFGMLVAHRYDSTGEEKVSASVPSIGFSSLSDGTPTMQFTWKW